MGIRIENQATPNLDTYVSETPTPEVLEEIFAAEDETETPERSSIIQTGWAAAKKAVAKSSKTFATEGDPLIAVGSKPDQKFAFTVLNLSDEDPQLQLMIVGIRLCGQLEKLDSNPKTGPLNRPDLYWAVSKSGTGTKTSYTINPVKERDLAEDWGIDPVAAAELIKTMKPLGPEALHTSTKAELAEIAREIASAN